MTKRGARRAPQSPAVRHKIPLDILEGPVKNPLVILLPPGRPAVKIWENGRIEGMPKGTGIVNTAASVLDVLRSALWKAQ